MSADGISARRGETRAAVALAAGLTALAFGGLAAALTRVNVDGRWQGIYVLRAKDAPYLELKDDLALGDGDRLVASVSFSRLIRIMTAHDPPKPGASLELQWDDADGSGIVTNHLGDGTELITIFSRYTESDGGSPHGLFVGVALPDVAADPRSLNESGMSFHDARGWTHIWCNVNEGLFDPLRHDMIYPSEFRFLGSRVLVRDRRRVVIESSHEIRLVGGTLRMNRYAYFTAGEPFFKLSIHVLNLEERDVVFSYAYGDEPWVGNFGSAEGNKGWVAGRRVEYEGVVDLARNRWAGIVDDKTGAADFISWIGGDLPNMVYFSNGPGGLDRGGKPVPLTSNEVFIGLQWENRRLGPGESSEMRLGIGMAASDPLTGIPTLPRGAGPTPAAP